LFCELKWREGEKARIDDEEAKGRIRIDGEEEEKEEGRLK
jgi:hypothetical protein